MNCWLWSKASLSGVFPSKAIQEHNRVTWHGNICCACMYLNKWTEVFIRVIVSCSLRTCGWLCYTNRCEQEEGSLASRSKKQGKWYILSRREKDWESNRKEVRDDGRKSCRRIVWKVANWVKWPRSIAVAAIIRAGQIHWVKKGKTL